MANMLWVLFSAFMVMLMQAGFALSETGLCRAKNAAHTMAMNFLAYALGMAGFFVCGFALMCGGAGAGAAPEGLASLDRMLSVGGGWGMLGYKGFFLSGGSYDPAAVAWFVFMMVLMGIAATIPTGALAERWSFKSFAAFSVVVGAVIYPVYGCWMWGGGWLSQLGTRAGLGHGAVDFAGSSVVHLVGGTLALVTAWLIGPRIGKYDESGRPRPILGHHVPMVMLGTLILAFGWFGFTAGAALAHGSPERLGVVAANTALASGAGALVACFFMWWRFGKPDASMLCNGMLAGLVAISAPCAFVAPWAAALIGAIAGLLGVSSVFFWERRGIDDPVGAISVHAVNGVWGMLALGLFADGTYGANWNAAGAGGGRAVAGLFYGDARQLLAQLIAVAVCVAWTALAGGVAFYLIGRFVGGNRVAADVEIAGLDVPEVGAPAYPQFIDTMSPEDVSPSEIAAAKAQLR